MNQLSPAEYDAHTKQHYQDSAIAETYRDEYAGPFSLRSIPARIVAMRERRIVHSAITDIVKHTATPIHKALDLPCGTGKLAPVFSHFDFGVVAADISRQMMDVAAAEYQGSPGFAGFIQTDASATKLVREDFDLVVCLRLLHRVPDEVRTTILTELCRISRKHVIVSVGLTNGLQEFRRKLRQTVTGALTVPYPVTRSTFGAQLASACLTPIRWKPVLPLVSSEWIVTCEKSRG
jgi:2-polyprenyl-3-methyl-5-hydroxy-6-metoxy-1,4-benzoquinol methylase